MYQIIDSETNLKNVGEDAVGKMKANPFHPDNYAVYWGYETSKGEMAAVYHRKLYVEEDVDLLVGHNIKFDLHYMWKADPEMHAKMYTGTPTMRIWCTQLAEYLLTGQDAKWASLDQLAEKYGGTIKDSKIKEYWDAGVDTEDIPREEIIPYLRGDIRNTRIVFLAQVAEAMKLNMLPLIVTQMKALLATAEMEFNGMAFDKIAALEHAVEVSKEIKALEDDLAEMMEDRGMTDPNPHSSIQIATYLFGGNHKSIVRVPEMGEDGKPVRYKSGARKGEIKLKREELVEEIAPLCMPEKAWEGKTTISVANDVLGMIKRDPKYSIDHSVSERFVDKLLEYRRLQKDVKTYYVGFSALTWPTGFIHGNFNHATTNTGRLSSSAPNLQNVTTKGEE